MIDSVLKGTGNSRFLKSAVPAGTSWADALAMLQAGTFPIDFNGINTEGFQQVGTPLNKANLLKDATAAQIGLPPSTTPDGMFQALGNTGELHVWRKMVVNSQDVAASYTLGEKANIRLASQSVSDGSGSATRVTVLVANSISVSDSGAIIPGTTTEYYAYPGSISAGTLTDSVIAGKFIFVSTVGSNVQLEDVALRDIYYAPSDATLRSHTASPRRYLIASNLQKVIGHPYQPAGTTTTYPVSTNPNAYQEGEYGKAGYTLGDVKTGTFQIGQGATTSDTNRAIIKYGASISVTDTGTASIASESEKTVTSDTSLASLDGLKGKFFRFSQLPFSSSAFSVGKIYFFPANTVFTKQSSGNWYASKYQTVTSHGKTEPEYTIEYLGKLGDKARVQVVSYVGTGTYGESNPNSLTFDFVPNAVFLFSPETHKKCFVAYGDTSGYPYDDNPNGELVVSWDKKKMSWFQYDSANNQLNLSNYKYRAIAIG